MEKLRPACTESGSPGVLVWEGRSGRDWRARGGRVAPGPYHPRKRERKGPFLQVKTEWASSDLFLAWHPAQKCFKVTSEFSLIL